MKILHIISGDIFAGAEMQVFQTLQALKNKNLKLDIYCILFNSGLLEQKLKNIGISTHVIKENHSNIFNLFWKVRKLIGTIKPDLIHAHRAKEHAIGFFSQLLTLRTIPIFRTVHGLTGKSIHKSRLRRFKWCLATILESILIKYLSNGIIAVSDDMFQYLNSLNVFSKVIKLYNSLDLSDYTISKQSESSDNIKIRYSVSRKFWVGTTARLAAPKNLSVFIDAAHLLNISEPETFKFSIFGEGPLQNELQTKINNLHLNDSFTLHGFEQHIIPVIASFDLFILCSLHEGLPMALLEAMALGRPVVCTAVGGMKELITSHKNGILIPSNNPKALAEGITLLYHNKTLRQSIGNNAREHIQNSYSIHNITDSLLNEYLHFSRSSVI